MNRSRKQSGKDHFDLLPFISILMCVMGVLLLVTMSITAISIGPGVGEGWVPTPDPNRKTKTPVLVEWDGETAVIHQEDKKQQIKWSFSVPKPGSLNFALPEPPPELKNFINDLQAKKDTHYALFAVRPSGFLNFHIFADSFRRRQIDVGYEPIKQSKAVRLMKTGGKQQ